VRSVVEERRAVRRNALACLLVLLLTRLAGAAPRVDIDSARFGNLFVLGERPRLRVTVTAGGDALHGRLEVRATDAYRGRAGRARHRVALAPGAAQAFDFPIRSRRPLGHFTVRARLRRGRGQPPLEGSTTAAIVPPLDTSDAEDSAVGYFVYPPVPSELPRAADVAEQMRILGIRWVRLTYNWWADGRAEPPDTSDPGWLDTDLYERFVDAYRASGIEVLGVLFGTARWASSAPDATEKVGGVPRFAIVKPARLDDWLLFARTLSTRLEGRVRSWEIWNEPDVPSFWQSGAEDFTVLARATADVLHEVDPDMRVAVNLLDRGTEEGLAFSGAVLARVGDVLDVFGLHYGSDDWVADVARLAPPMLRPGASLWNTEAWGAPRRQISTWLAQRAAGVERIFPYIYHTPLDDAVGEEFLRFGRYPVNADYTPRPDAVALRTLSDMVGSATPLAAADVGLGYQATTFQTTHGPVVALADRNELGETWNPPGLTLSLSVPTDVRHVRVVDLMGNRQVLRARRGRLRLPLLGVAAFLHVDPPATLAGLRVVQVRQRLR
jgi:hypothetical protein